MKRFWGAALLAMLALAVAVAAAQTLPWQKNDPRAQDVRYLFPEQVSVAAGKDAVVEMHFRINPGMHINSHMPSLKWLIATRLTVGQVPGVKMGAVEFPKGSEYALAAFPKEKLSVYSGDFVLQAHIKATAGQHLLQGALRYQACDVNACYPPREAPVVVDVVAR
ncbi:MAG: protein-disulfide reductase DsbD domain-containing protein [Acidobacteriaceae bacterium]